jgi:hypothetical protein
MDYESIPDFTFDVDNNIICSGDKTELHLNIAEGHNSKNHKYEIEGSDGKPVDINNLVFFPTEGITYTVTATSDACQSIISREISLYVVLPIALNLETVPSPVLKTLGYEEAVCAPATVSFILKDNLNLTSWDWEYRKKGEKDFTKWETESTKTTNSFEVTEETSFRVTSKVDTEVCKNFSSFTSLCKVIRLSLSRYFITIIKFISTFSTLSSQYESELLFVESNVITCFSLFANSKEDTLGSKTSK